MARRTIRIAVVSILLCCCPPLRAEASKPVARSTHFVFHSDFDTNLNDALLTAGIARNKGKPELFQSGEEEKCFGELAPSARTAWNLAVDWYADVVSPKSWGDRAQVLLRYDLAGIAERVDERGRTFVGIARGLMAAATPAYRACRWAAQDRENREWIEALTPGLEAHGDSIGKRIEEVYSKSWHGLPIRVDVVASAPPLGANTWILDPGGLILISSSTDRTDALETVFHEASHTLMAPWRPDPVPGALNAAAEAAGVEIIRDLWHVVLFYSTGQVVREVLDAEGEPGYTPYMERHGLWRGSWAPYRKPVEAAWPAWLNGERTLDEAASDLMRAIRRDRSSAE